MVIGLKNRALSLVVIKTNIKVNPIRFNTNHALRVKLLLLAVNSLKTKHETNQLTKQKLQL
jgi:hypothetical protein